MFMAQELKRQGSGTIVAVDTWLGAIEFWTKHMKGPTDSTRDLKWVNGYPSVYYDFLSNVVHANVTKQVVPFPAPSTLAATFFKRKGIRAEIVHIDASHEYEDVATDLRVWSEVLATNGVLFGDDYNPYWRGVVRAIDEFVAADSKRKLHRSGNKWLVSIGLPMQAKVSAIDETCTCTCKMCMHMCMCM